jgi:hypothetical protein
MTDSGKRPSFRVAILGLGEAAERNRVPACAFRRGIAVTSAWRRFMKRLQRNSPSSTGVRDDRRG